MGNPVVLFAPQSGNRWVAKKDSRRTERVSTLPIPTSCEGPCCVFLFCNLRVEVLKEYQNKLKPIVKVRGIDYDYR